MIDTVIKWLMAPVIALTGVLALPFILLAQYLPTKWIAGWNRD